MKRITSLLLALALLLAAAGCTGRAAQKENTSPVGSAEPLPAPAPEPEPAPAPAPAPEPEPEPEEPYVRVVDPQKPMVALTFDDGPHETYTQDILDILEEHHAVATFFELGRSVARYPDALPRMAELGCEVGSHSQGHRDLSKLKRAALLDDLAAADRAFLDAGAAAPTLVRPPYGAVNKTVKSGTGRAVVTWTVDTLDWSSKDTDAVVKHVQEQKSLDGEIVLMHSIYGTTVEAVRILVPWLQEQGYQLVTVSELMAYYYGELPAANQFYGYTYFSSHSRTDAPLQLPEEPMAVVIPEAPAEPVTPTPAPAPQPEPTPEPEPAPEEPPIDAVPPDWLLTGKADETGEAEEPAP